MTDPEDLKEYFNEDEWNCMSDAEKARFANFAVTIDVFNTKLGSDVKQEPIELTDTNNATTSGCSDEKYEAVDIGDTKISRVEESPENLIDACDDEITCEKKPVYEYCERCGGSAQGVCTKCHLDCEPCKQICLGLCSHCPVVTYILNNNVQWGTEDALNKTLPKDILEIKKSPTRGICSLMTIPGGITFGPCGELDLAERETGYKWKLNYAKFANVENSEESNWMRLVNRAKRATDQNLNIFQCEDRLYYRSSRKIEKGEELLVYYGEEHADNIGTETENYYCALLEQPLEDVYACTFCCLGFGSETNLIQHRTKCEQAKTSNCCLEEIIQCPYCKIYLDEGEYLRFHGDCCSEKYSRKCIPSMIGGQVRGAKAEVPGISGNTEETEDRCTGSERIRRRLKNNTGEKDYSCSQCQFKSNEKESFLKHGPL